MMLQKMPVRQDETNYCAQHRSTAFFVYAEGVVYEVAVYSKMPANDRLYCYELFTPFGAGTLEKRLDKLATSEAAVIRSETKTLGRDAHRFATAESTRLVISEINERQRWIELAVHHYAGDTPDFDRFLKSIEFSAKSGKEIGAGVDSVIADTMPKSPAAATVVKKDPTPSASDPGLGSGFGVRHNGPGAANASPVKTDRYRTISQPKALYTEAARNADIQGPVRVKITLLASGGIGSVAVVTQLSHGLTENAIAAAKRIVFLPKRVNDIPLSVVVTREYTFTIY